MTITWQVGGWGEPQGKGLYVLEDGSKHEGEVRKQCTGAARDFVSPADD